jgi:hypothetical protein
MRRSPIFVTTTLAFLASSAGAADWKPVLISPKSNTYYDSSTIRRDGPVVSVWTNTTFNPPLGDTASAKLLMQLDCAADRGRRVEVTAFRADGSVIGTQTDAEPWERVAPGTLGERVKSLVCPVPQPVPAPR